MDVRLQRSRILPVVFAVFSLIPPVALHGQGSGLNDIEFLPPGKYPAQKEQLIQTGYFNSKFALPLFARPGTRQAYPASSVVNSTSASYCPTHIHNFYHSGHSEFQCPLIEGGRTRIVTVHPRTGQPIEFFAVLSAGAPLVKYDKHGFKYIYNDHQTDIRFPSTLNRSSAVTVRQRTGVPLSAYASRALTQLRESGDGLRRTNTVQSVLQLGKDGVESLKGAGVAADRAIGSVFDSARQASSLLPGKTYLQSLSEQRALDIQENSARDVQRESVGLGRFIRRSN